MTIVGKRTRVGIGNQFVGDLGEGSNPTVALPFQAQELDLSSIVSIFGEANSGKSRMAHEIALELSEDHPTFVYSHVTPPLGNEYLCSSNWDATINAMRVDLERFGKENPWKVIVADGDQVSFSELQWLIHGLGNTIGFMTQAQGVDEHLHLGDYNVILGYEVDPMGRNTFGVTINHLRAGYSSRHESIYGEPHGYSD